MFVLDCKDDILLQVENIFYVTSYDSSESGKIIWNQQIFFKSTGTVSDLHPGGSSLEPKRNCGLSG
jgi:hypothetical protein